MEKSGGNPPKKQHTSAVSPSRREFLKLSALGALAMGSPAVAKDLIGKGAGASDAVRGNGIPGKIVLCHDPLMNGHTATIDRDRVEASLHESIRLLTDIPDIGTAMESFFPGVHASSTFAIKVNCIGTTCTRWEVVRGIVSGLSQMAGGTYDVSNVTIFDRDNPHYSGYTESEFEFNGNTAYIATGNNANDSGHIVWEDHHLSRYLLNTDYVINVPALKSHTHWYNQITVGMKNHYGSCDPSDLCNDSTMGMLPLNSDTNLKDKTGLVVTDAIRATYYGGPGEPPQNWSIYDEATPNSLLVTTDPVTNEYWARDMINAQRVASGYSPRACAWIEAASEDPYNLGVSDPAEMTVINYDPTISVDDPGVAVPDGALLVASTPNPFSARTTLRFRLADASDAKIEIFAPSGRIVRQLGGQQYPAGMGEVVWDGLDQAGRRVSAGVYIARLTAGRAVTNRRVVMVR